MYIDAYMCSSREKPSFRVRTETATQTTDVWTRRRTGGRREGWDKLGG